MFYRTGLILNASISLMTFLLSLTALNAFGFVYSGSYYPFGLPTVAIALYCLSLPTLGLVRLVPRKAAFWGTVPMGCLTYLASLYAMSRWPGGDDGPGMFWALFVGAGSGLMSLANIILLVVGAARVLKKRDDP